MERAQLLTVGSSISNGRVRWRFDSGSVITGQCTYAKRTFITERKIALHRPAGRNASLVLIRWSDAVRCIGITAYPFFIGPLFSHFGRCHFMLSDSLLSFGLHGFCRDLLEFRRIHIAILGRLHFELYPSRNLTESGGSVVIHRLSRLNNRFQDLGAQSNMHN